MFFRAPSPNPNLNVSMLPSCCNFLIRYARDRPARPGLPHVCVLLSVRISQPTLLLQKLPSCTCVLACLDQLSQGCFRHHTTLLSVILSHLSHLICLFNTTHQQLLPCGRARRGLSGPKICCLVNPVCYVMLLRRQRQHVVGTTLPLQAVSLCKQVLVKTHGARGKLHLGHPDVTRSPHHRNCCQRIPGPEGRVRAPDEQLLPQVCLVVHLKPDRDHCTVRESGFLVAVRLHTKLLFRLVILWLIVFVLSCGPLRGKQTLQARKGFATEALRVVNVEFVACVGTRRLPLAPIPASGTRDAPRAAH
mmetsp:Transcript_32159/g.70162  ORF Transcript_32159/g.70162 Transcript_32159/m.70162 type:complete len:305 (-) Transcript_32159:164-1078(-)